MYCNCEGKFYADYSCESALALQIVSDFSHLSYQSQISWCKQVEIQLDVVCCTYAVVAVGPLWPSSVGSVV